MRLSEYEKLSFGNRGVCFYFRRYEVVIFNHSLNFLLGDDSTGENSFVRNFPSNKHLRCTNVHNNFLFDLSYVSNLEAFSLVDKQSNCANHSNDNFILCKINSTCNTRKKITTKVKYLRISRYRRKLFEFLCRSLGVDDSIDV